MSAKDVKKVLIVGATAPDVIKIISAVNRAGAEQIVIQGFLDDDRSKTGQEFMGYPIVGTTAILENGCPDIWVLNNVARDMNVRAKVCARLDSLGVRRHLTLIHPSVDTAYTTIGEGCIIHEGVSLGPDCVIGRHCVMLANCTAGHECIVEDLVFVGNNVILGARGCIETGSFVGLNSVILPYRKLGARSMIGAGSVVIRDVPADTTVFGNPARVGVRPASAAD